MSARILTLPPHDKSSKEDELQEDDVCPKSHGAAVGDGAAELLGLSAERRAEVALLGGCALRHCLQRPHLRAHLVHLGPQLFAHSNLGC